MQPWALFYLYLLLGRSIICNYVKTSIECDVQQYVIA